MKSQFRITACALAGLAVLVSLAALEARQDKHVVVPADKVVWGPIEVPGFPSGMQIATISGDPNAKTGSYVIRLQFPAGYMFPAHYHPNAENLTVLSGTFLLAMGNKADNSKLVSYAPGSFMSIPGKMPHFGGAKGPTVIQLHGLAPFAIELAK